MATVNLELSMAEVERMGSITRQKMAAMREELKRNQYMAPETARMGKLAMFGAAAVAGVAGVVALASAPVLGIAALAIGGGLVAGGNRIQQKAEYLSGVRSQMTEYMQRREQAMGNLKGVHREIKHAIGQQSADVQSGPAVRGDYHRLQMEVAQNQRNQLATEQRTREVLELSLEGSKPSNGPRVR
jgi:hypothetical protein|tara:strand:+ start:762 stop:1319 length:558 start_codon:yes stop_codon:yes gene_type:complete